MASNLLHLAPNFPPPSPSPSSTPQHQIRIPAPQFSHTLSKRAYIPEHVYKHPTAILLELCTSIQELHQFIPPIIKNGFYNEHLFQTKLVSLFCNYGALQEAVKVFDPIEDKIDPLYHTLLKGYTKFASLEEAVRFFNRMRCDGVVPVVYNFAYLLKVCGTESDYRLGRELHGQLVVNGYALNLFAMTSLANMYAKCGLVEDAYKMFDRMPEKDLVSWNTVISGYAQNGKAKIAMEMVLRMQEEKVRPDSITMVSVLPAAADMGSLRIGKTIHGFVIRDGCDSQVNICTALVDMYGKCGRVDVARLIFDKMERKTVVTWNSMIDGYVQGGYPEKGLEIFDKMLNEGVEPSDVSIMEALHACADLGDVEKGMAVHRLMDELGLGENVSVMNSLISMYSKCMRVDKAADVFDKLQMKTTVSWNAMILGFAQNGHINEALTCFCKMQAENIKPDSFTMVSVIPAVAELSILRQAKWIHGLVVRAGFEKNVYVVTALVDMYAKCGAVDTARKLFDMMGERHVMTWNAMIDGYGTHGQGKAAIELFDEMLKNPVKPNHITFLCIISACSHSGFVDEGLSYFESMKDEYGIQPLMDHYGAVVDLLGRSGRLDEAWEFIQKMPVQPGMNVYGAMLGACKIRNNVELGEKAAIEIFKLGPDEGGYHVLLANIYASASMWDKVVEVRSRMARQGLRKTPGCSVVELNSQFHSFHSGTTTHPQSSQIYTYLEKLGDEIRDAGYVPDTNSIHDVEDDVKEQLLNSHSEKLAIAFALLNTRNGTTIHVRKNLRVCADCHSATKYISLVTKREIVVRDMHRFHHFKNGTCSCGDYW
uniref:DYW domain-containing protein n=1 Tax=Kalanchoe fedtschenkoi TaxID=63787 RepID=A0A7N0T930_KALFE